MNKPTEEDIQNWYKVLYRDYPNDLCHGKKGNEIPIKSAMRKKINSQGKFDEIIRNIKALIKYDRLDNKPDRWPLISTFLNQEYYNRNIGSTAELKEKQEVNKCCIADCKNDVVGESYPYCYDHVPNAHSDLLAKAWKTTGLKYGSPDFVNECRAMCKSGMKSIVTKMDSIK